MDYTNIIIAACSVVTVIFTMISFMGKKFDGIEKKFDGIGKKFDELGKDIRNLDNRLSRIEGYIERDLVDKHRYNKPTGTE